MLPLTVTGELPTAPRIGVTAEAHSFSILFSVNNSKIFPFPRTARMVGKFLSPHTPQKRKKTTCLNPANPALTPRLSGQVVGCSPRVRRDPRGLFTYRAARPPGRQTEADERAPHAARGPSPLRVSRTRPGPGRSLARSLRRGLRASSGRRAARPVAAAALGVGGVGMAAAGLRQQVAPGSRRRRPLRARRPSSRGGGQRPGRLRTRRCRRRHHHHHPPSFPSLRPFPPSALRVPGAIATASAGSARPAATAAAPSPPPPRPRPARSQRKVGLRRAASGNSEPA